MTKQQIEAFNKIKGPWGLKPCSHGGLIVTRGDGSPGGHPQSHVQIVTEEDAIGFAALPELLAEREKMIAALNAISLLWPKPPDCALVNPEWVGPHDGKSRAILLEAALDIARKALAESEGGE